MAELSWTALVKKKRATSARRAVGTSGRMSQSPTEAKLVLEGTLIFAPSLQFRDMLRRQLREETDRGAVKGDLGGVW